MRMAGRLWRSNPLEEGSREQHKIRLWSQGQHKRGRLAGRCRKTVGPQRKKEREMRRRRVESSEGQPAAQRDAVRPHCLLTEKPSHDSPPDGTNLHIPPLTGCRPRLLGEPRRAGRAGRRARLHGARGAAVRGRCRSTHSRLRAASSPAPAQGGSASPRLAPLLLN